MKTFDVTEPIGIIVNKQGGKKLTLSRNVDLTAEFGDPCQGIRKALTINYQVLGMAGRIQLNEKNNILLTCLTLGYPPEHINFGTESKMGFVEKIKSSRKNVKTTAKSKMSNSENQRK